MNAINQVLRSLDPSNDEHWTNDGSPRVEVVSELLDQEVTRKDIVQAAPQFNRSHAMSLKEDEEQENEQKGEQENEQKGEQEGEQKGEQEGKGSEGPGWCPDELLAELQAAQREQREAEAAQQGAHRHLLEVNDKVAKIEERIEQHRPRHSDQEQIMAYIASQNENRRRRSGAMVQTKAPRSMLDKKLKERPRPVRGRGQ